MKIWQALTYLSILLAAYTVGACSALAPKTTEQAVSVVQKYCALASVLERQALRGQVNGELAKINPADPPTIKVHCPGDKD